MNPQQPTITPKTALQALAIILITPLLATAVGWGMVYGAAGVIYTVLSLFNHHWR